MSATVTIRITSLIQDGILDEHVNFDVLVDGAFDSTHYALCDAVAEKRRLEKAMEH